MESNRKIHFNMNQEDISYVSQIFESYEGIGLLRTINPETTHMCIYTNVWMVEKCLTLIDNLIKKEKLNIFNVHVEISSTVE